MSKTNNTNPKIKRRGKVDDLLGFDEKKVQKLIEFSGDVGRKMNRDVKGGGACFESVDFGRIYVASLMSMTASARIWRP